MKCTDYQNLTVWQHGRLIQHIKDNQYYLGEKLGHFVDWTDAEHDFFDNYCSTVGKELRLEYCGSRCEYRLDCDLGKSFCNS